MSDAGKHYVDIFVSAHVLGDPAPKVHQCSFNLTGGNERPYPRLVAVLALLDHGAVKVSMLGVGHTGAAVG
jgi:hypothetical protein